MLSLVVEFPWAPFLVLLPLAAGLVCFLIPRIANAFAIFTLIVLTLFVIGLTYQVSLVGPYQHKVGGWGTPLGISLYADGFSVIMLALTAVVGLAVSIYSAAYFKRDSLPYFWPLWLFLLAALNALFLSADIFNLYVSLEMIALSAVALTALQGGKDALAGAMRYLLATLFGSLAFLLGVVLLYHGFATVDIPMLADRIQAIPVTWAALGFMVAGLALKASLFPMHFWLPPAHASASAPVSALLSALVVKAAVYILIRLWLELFAPLAIGTTDLLLGTLGALAVLWGSLQALRQTRLKLLIAYSTVAQIGYFFLAFPLAASAGSKVWNAVIYLIISHALAKSAMFLAAGNLLRFTGHDRIVDLKQIVQQLPITATAFALAGISIVGLPPSGGFVGKWILLEAAIAQGRWDLLVIMIIGGLLAAAYLFKVLGHAFVESTETQQTTAVAARMQWVALFLALAVIALGFLAGPIFSIANIGSPFSMLKGGV